MTEGRCWVKVHHSKTGEVLVAVCDHELLGQRLKIADGLKVEVHGSFYGGFLADVENIGSHLRRATILNLLGARSVGVAVSLGLAKKESVVNVDGVPHLQIFL